MTKRKFIGRVLVGDRRSAHRCVVAGCAEVPAADALICTRLCAASPTYWRAT